MTSCATCQRDFAASSDRRVYCSRECYLARPLVGLAERFWVKVNKDGPVPSGAPELGPCWLWTGATDGHGYGQMSARRVSSSPVKAHRVAWFLEHGSWPMPEARHRCDGGKIGCVRASHLEEGTHAQNMRDMSERNRAVTPMLRGEAHARAKLTTADVVAIREKHASGARLRELAKAYGVSADNIGLIVRRKAWAHVG